MNVPGMTEAIEEQLRTHGVTPQALAGSICAVATLVDTIMEVLTPEQQEAIKQRMTERADATWLLVSSMLADELHREREDE